MTNGKKDVGGKKSFAARKVARDKHRRRAKTPTEIRTGMQVAINQQLKGVRAHNNELVSKLAREGKISKATAKVIRARYTKDEQQARYDAAESGALAAEMVEEDGKLAATVAVGTLGLWADLFEGEEVGPPEMVVGEEMEDASGPDEMEEADEDEKDDYDDDEEEQDLTAPGPASPFTTTELSIRSRPSQ